MANPNDLNLNQEPVEGDFENMPTGMSSILPPPQPGQYIFQFPKGEILYHAFATIDHPQQGQRLQIELKDEAALVNKSLNDQPYHANISNVTRVINFKSGPVVVSDMAMLLKALGITPEELNNGGYAQAILMAGEKTFKGQHELSTNCSDKRDIYVGGQQQKGKKGCGQRFALQPYVPKSPAGAKPVLGIPKEDDNPNKYKLQFDCVCGASLRSWGRLRGFKSHNAAA